MASVQERANYYLVDPRGEGGLVSELDRVAMVDEPTLIIGLGGTGADALLNTKYVLHRKLKFPEGQSKPSRLAYLAIDTDASDLEKKRVGDTRLHASETCDITEMNLKAYMNDHKMITRPYLRDWLCNGIPPLAVAFGAGGIRQYGRFMLLSKAEDVSSRIMSAINQIWAAGKENGAPFNAATDSVNVYIMAGISGGTGSGTFLDVAYMVREIVTRKMSQRMHLRLRGVIFMPEVNLSKVKSEQVRKYLPVNGYAALKELDFWMNPERGRHFKQRYSESLNVDTNDMPYDMCFMVSPNMNDRDPYTTCMQTVGEAMLNILSASVSTATGATQGFESFISNLVSMLPHVTKPYAGNYIFSTMGMDERRLQLDQMATYIAYYLLMQVQKLFDRQPLKDDVLRFYRDLMLDEHSMERLFDRKLSEAVSSNRGQENKNLIRVSNSDAFKEYASVQYNRTQALDDQQIENELNAWVIQKEKFYNKQRDEVIEERVEFIAQEIEKMFIDQEIGPFYAHRMLHNTTVGAEDILKMLRASINAIESELIAAETRRANYEAESRKAKEDARRSRYVPIIGPAKYEDYLEAVFQYYNYERHIRFAQIQRKIYMELESKVVDYNNMVVEKFVTLLNALTEVFKANSDIITDVKRDGNTHNWNVFNFKDIKPHIDKAIANMRQQGQITMLVHEFLSMLLEEREAWLDDNGELGASFSKFVSVKFGEIMNMSLESHYMTMLGLKTTAELREHIARDVMSQLNGGSKVMFQANDTLCPVHFSAERSLICYPHVATTIAQGVNDFVSSYTDPSGKALAANCDVIPSYRRGSIFWFRATFGMPLYTVSSIANYQAAYDAYGLVDHHLGRHLKMGADENWVDLLPPLMPDSIWAYQGYDNPQLAEKNDNNRTMFQKAWDAGIVLPMPLANGKFVVGRVNEEKLSQLIASAPLSAADQQLIAEQGAAAAATVRADMRQVEAFLAGAKAFAQNGWETSEDMLKSDVFQTLRGGVLVEPTAGPKRDCQILSENLTLTPDTAEKLRHQLELKQKLMDVIAVHETFTKLGDLEKNQRSFFAKCLFYGLYRKIPPKLYQLDGAAEGVAPFMLMALGDYALAPVKDNYYAMYRKFNTLTAEQKAVMQKLVDMRTKSLDNEVMTGNLDRYTQYITNVQAADASIEKRMNEIYMDATYNHPEVIEFYQALRDEFAMWLSEE